MRAFLAMAFVLALALPAGADHCSSWTTSAPEVEAGSYYVDIDCPPHTCNVDAMPQPWIYGESNGIPGLQRGDELRDDTCHGMIEADTLIF